MLVYQLKKVQFGKSGEKSQDKQKNQEVVLHLRQIQVLRFNWMSICLLQCIWNESNKKKLSNFRFY